ncbi:MAG TPA: DUF4388 domain-containing protein [Candidatus Brocadiia bacterium]|nr:DUF4388 domain-containing protein [Candidatus Brocadiia bacterium]
MRAYVAVIIGPDEERGSVLSGCLRIAGYKVMRAEGIESAIPLLESCDADVVIAGMGNIQHGNEALYERVQVIRRNAGVPFVFLCADEAAEKELRATDRPCCEYTREPVRPPELLRRVAMALKRAQNEWTRQETIEGDTDSLPLADVLQALGLNGRTCIVEMTGADSIGTIFLKQGQIVQADVGEADGMEALKTMLSWRKAQYSVSFQPVQEKNVFNLSTDAILVEAKAGLLGSEVKDAWTPPWQKSGKAEPAIPAAAPAPVTTPADPSASSSRAQPSPLRELIKESIIQRNYRQAMTDLESLIQLEGADKNLKDARQLLQLQIQKYL